VGKEMHTGFCRETILKQSQRHTIEGNAMDNLTQDREKWQYLIDIVMNPWVK